MERKYKKLLLVLLPVIAVILVLQTASAVYLDVNRDIWEAADKEEQNMEQIRQVPETKDALLSYVQEEIQKLETAGTLTNDALTELFTECDAEDYIHITKEGQSYITAKDGGEIMVSELSSAYVHRLTQKAFEQMIEIAETYVEHRKEATTILRSMIPPPITSTAQASCSWCSTAFPMTLPAMLETAIQQNMILALLSPTIPTAVSSVLTAIWPTISAAMPLTIILHSTPMRTAPMFSPATSCSSVPTTETKATL